MPLAALLVAGMTILAITISRTTVQAGLSVSQEIVTLQAFYSAESGAQRGMSNLFYGASLLPSAVDTACTNMNISRNFNVTGLDNCEVSVSCAVTVASGTHYYTLTSIGDCGSGDIRSQRTVEVSAFLE